MAKSEKPAATAEPKTADPAGTTPAPPAAPKTRTLLRVRPGYVLTFPFDPFGTRAMPGDCVPADDPLLNPNVIPNDIRQEFRINAVDHQVDFKLEVAPAGSRAKPVTDPVACQIYRRIGFGGLALEEPVEKPAVPVRREQPEVPVAGGAIPARDPSPGA